MKGMSIYRTKKNGLENLIDSYVFYCVSENPLSNLMWSHYADSHNGFCIKFKSDFLKVDKVTYQKQIPSINIVDLIKFHMKITNGEYLVSTPHKA